MSLAGLNMFENIAYLLFFLCMSYYQNVDYCRRIYKVDIACRSELHVGTTLKAIDLGYAHEFLTTLNTVFRPTRHLCVVLNPTTIYD